METGAKSSPFRYDKSWSITQTMAELGEALDLDADIAISTSGSTGKPKEILIPASAARFSARIANEYLGAKPGDCWSLLLSPEHAAGINVLVRSIELGTDPVTVNEKAEFTSIVPTQLFNALHGDAVLLSHLQGCRAVLVGGAATATELLSSAKAAGINCITTYGMTETCGGCVYDGHPLPGVEVRINDTIEIKGPMLARVPLKDGFFVTSDTGKFQDGKLIVTGRIDDVIISGGKNLSLSKIESSLGFEYAALGKESAKWGMALQIATSFKPNEVSDDQIQAVLSESFGIKAEHIYRVKTIPRTTLQKVDRAALDKLLPNE